MLRRTIFLTALVLAVAAVPAQAIMGGRPASRPYPFMASLQGDGGHFCGGSLVRADWVLTAAHCMEGTSEEELAELRVVLGRVDLTEAGGEELAVDRYKVHEAFAGDEEFGHDVALLHLATPSAQPPIRIATPEQRALWLPGAPARVIGWGTSFYLVGPSPDDLQEVDVPIIDDAECEQSYDNTPTMAFNAETMVCAGEQTGLKDSCQGDSGGPLLAGDMAGEPVQVGTVSFGLGCGFPVYYGVYGRIADERLRTWLAANLPPEEAPAGAPAVAPTAAPPAPAAAAPPANARLRFRAKLGSARTARRRRAVRTRLTSSAPVTGVRATLRRGRRVIGRARLARLDGAATLKVRLRRRDARPGRLRLTVIATDAAGRRVTRTGTARLGR